MQLVTPKVVAIADCALPLPHRELLRAIVCVALDKGQRSIDLKALDSAYSIVFPRSSKLNVSKKKCS